MKWLILVSASLALVGCRQTSSVTEVRENGTFSRSIKLSAVDVNSQTKLKMSDLFVVPKGNGWSVKESEAEDMSGGTVIEARNAFPVGQEISDIGLILKGKVILVNSVKVTETSPGEYEYSETFTWKGDPGDPQESTKMMERLDEVLEPNSKITKEQKEEFVKEGDRLLVQLLFGPPEPTLSLAFSSPEFFLRKARATMGPALVKAAERIFGDALDANGRRNLVSKLLDPSLATDKVPKTAPSPGPAEESENEDQPTTLTMVVKMPGTITETNGLIDPLSGEVYWTMYKEAAQQGKVTLFARSKK